MRKFFSLYQYIVPILFFPLAYYLWYLKFQGDHRLVLLVLSIPILVAYVIPGIGTNYFKMWEFNTKLRIGKFRPHHGFVFGTGMSLFGLLCIPSTIESLGWFDMVRAGLITGSFMGFWNWIYDIYAIRSGFMFVYNRRYAEGAGPEAIATDYAPLSAGH